MRIAVCLLFLNLHAIYAQDPSVKYQDGQLEYVPDAAGNLISDFSHCGYAGGNSPIPTVRGVLIVRPSGSDDTSAIQAAVDHVSQLQADVNGFRGAVVLDRGEFSISGQIRVPASGIVLRGHGAGPGGTTLKATGTDRRPLITIGKAHSTSTEDPTAARHPIVAELVPAGTSRLRLASTAGLAAGQAVRVIHPSTKDWIAALGGDRLGWRENTRDIRWERTITSVDGHSVELDAPLTLSIHRELSEAFLQRRTTQSRLHHVGIEDLSLVSGCDVKRPHDEDHSWHGVHLQEVENAWVRRVAFHHFAGGAVTLGVGTHRISVEDCASLAPVSEVAGLPQTHLFYAGPAMPVLAMLVGTRIS